MFFLMHCTLGLKTVPTLAEPIIVNPLVQNLVWVFNYHTIEIFWGGRYYQKGLFFMSKIDFVPAHSFIEPKIFSTLNYDFEKSWATSL